MTAAANPTIEKLKSLRTRTDLKLKPTPLLKQTFTDFSGNERELAIRYYQVQGILHLIFMPRFLLGDDTGLGKTLQAIAALCYLWAKEPQLKAVVLTTKSATKQWAKEFSKFTRGVRVVVSTGSRAQRHAAYEAWRKPSTTPTVLISGYRSIVNDISAIQNDAGYVLICDEATAFKNPKTQVHQVVRHMSAQAGRCWGLTATLIKNHLMEGYGIYKVLVPTLFGSQNSFMYYFCIVEQMQVGRGRKVPKIVGYFPDKVIEFREVISPYYLGRPKHVVAAELPSLTRKVVEVGLTAAQEEKHAEALSNLLIVGEARKDGTEEAKEVTKLTALIYCQEIVDHPGLIECEGDSEKLDTLIEMLTEGDLEDEKVIVYTRFSKMVDILMPALKAAKIKAVRVTGEEDEDERQKAQDAFQNPNDDTRVVCITSAGSEAINLQAAKAIIFYDSPWSAGEYLQILGRMIRIGSEHDNVFAIHLVARPTTGKSIDEQVVRVIDKKMKLIEAVLGKRLKGKEDEPDQSATWGLDATSDINDLFNALRTA